MTDGSVTGRADFPSAHPGSADAQRLSAREVTLAYEQRVISDGLSLDVRDESFTVIVGPNACGKSTLLRALSRLLKPIGGAVVLDGRSIAEYRPKEVARQIALLPQSSIAPEGITVADLVARGRYPRQHVFRQWTSEDEDAVAAAMLATNVDELADRPVDELSGGQRQRVWAALALAQDTSILLLDEPTTFLDIAHQIELLDLFAGLHREGTTIVAVLHDLNHAARYATDLVVMKDGRVVTSGAPSDILTADLVEQVFGMPCLVIEDPVSGTPLVVPKGGHWRPDS